MKFLFKKQILFVFILSLFLLSVLLSFFVSNIKKNPNQSRAEVQKPVETEKTNEEIIGGRIVTNPDDYPYFAFLFEKKGTILPDVQNGNRTYDLSKSSYFCGGVVYNEYYILDVSHCLEYLIKKNNLDDFALGVGLINLKDSKI